MRLEKREIALPAGFLVAECQKLGQNRSFHSISAKTFSQLRNEPLWSLGWEAGHLNF
jgi:hypothetical protein